MFPLRTEYLDEICYYAGYRVVTTDMKSLGLRNNPNILTYPIGEWFYAPDITLKHTNDDSGGIWLARTPGSARKYQKYMFESKHNLETRVFLSLIDEILFVNQDRIKTNAIYLLKELDLSNPDVEYL